MMIIKHECLKNMLSLQPIFKNKKKQLKKSKVKSCYNPLSLGTVIVLISSGIDFVNTPHLYSDRATR